MCEHDFPQAGRRRLIAPSPIGVEGMGLPNPEAELIGSLDPDTVMMMGDNPALPRFPERPTLLDFFRLRMGEITFNHLLASAKHALGEGQPETVVMACLVHDISVGCFIRADHGYWGAQMVAPYVAEEVAFAIEKHQALRFYADEAAGYAYPDSYHKFFGPDYQPPEYIRREAEAARAHRWYGSARAVTVYDKYFFGAWEPIDPRMFEDIIGRNFRQPEEGLGFDGSPTAHMWRTMIWPNNFL
jgi:hypothetical protein